jgi:asparagine synthase (glutamine-hydrolysing)
MVHEPFYETGTWVDADIGFAMGWTSFPGTTVPYWNERHDICVFFFGDVYSPLHPGDPAAIRAAGTVARLYERSPSTFVSELNGLFCGLLLDQKLGRIHLFNDRFGAKRLYFTHSKDAFYFSSEAKSLLAELPAHRSIDPAALGEFLCCGSVLQNRTLFKGMEVLPPASHLVFEDENYSRHTYFHPSAWENQPPLHPTEYTDLLAATLQRIVPQYIAGHSKIGLSLTGGIDSRLVLAWTHAPGQCLRCFTFGGAYRDSADVQLARAIARIRGLPHETIQVGQDMLGQFTSLAEKTVYISDGTMDVSGAVELYVNRAARHIAPVRVTGNYGSEILRTNIAFRPRPIDSSLFEGMRHHLEMANRVYDGEIQGHPLTFVAFKCRGIILPDHQLSSLN